MTGERAGSYRAAGVDVEGVDVGLRSLTARLRETWDGGAGTGAVKLDFGFFANVVDVGGVGVAITTDGVGTKALVAQMVGRYDTIGIDCVAMNVNDLLCVGARPVSMVDHIAVADADPWFLDEISKGLAEGARMARTAIVGGEIAQVPEMIAGAGDGFHFDLGGTAIGVVDLDRILVGDDLQDGDVVIGVASSGIHSNGLTLARRVLFDQAGYRVDSTMPDLGVTVGEELLRPTTIYVAEALDLLASSVAVRAFIHLTGDGFFNLVRVKQPVSYVIDSLPDSHPIFQLIQREGKILDEEMYRVFNMGVGFCAIVAPSDVDLAVAILGSGGKPTHVIGRVVNDGRRQVAIHPVGLVGRNKRFEKV